MSFHSLNTQNWKNGVSATLKWKIFPGGGPRTPALFWTQVKSALGKSLESGTFWFIEFAERPEPYTKLYRIVCFTWDDKRLNRCEGVHWAGAGWWEKVLLCLLFKFRWSCGWLNVLWQDVKNRWCKIQRWRLEKGGIGFGQLKKVMVAKRVINACARVTNVLEVWWGPRSAGEQPCACREKFGPRPIFKIFSLDQIRVDQEKKEVRKRRASIYRTSPSDAVEHFLVSPVTGWAILGYPALELHTGIFPFVFFLDTVLPRSSNLNLKKNCHTGKASLVQGVRIDLIRNYGPGTRDGASGFDRAAGTVASCSFVVEEFDR